MMMEVEAGGRGGLRRDVQRVVSATARDNRPRSIRPSIRATMAPPRRGRLGRWLDDYIEEVGVGTPWWVLVLLFGTLLPVGQLGVDWLLHRREQPGTFSLDLLIGVFIGLAIALIARERMRHRAATVDWIRDLETLRKMPWGEFEILVAEAIRRQSYLVKPRGGFQADGGVDMIAEGRGRRIAVQCKHWRKYRVGPDVIQQLYGVVKGGGFQEGWLVTCGQASKAARDWARGKELRIIEGDELMTMIGPEAAAGLSTATAAVGDVPECPDCGRPMIRRRNSYDDSEFWGCTGYRECEWTADDPPPAGSMPICSLGHPMELRATERGIEFWGCSTYPDCKRKRLTEASILTKR